MSGAPQPALGSFPMALRRRERIKRLMLSWRLRIEWWRRAR
jgi:hypothetical protein